MINGFFGEYRFLSNFHPSPIIVDSKTYQTVEHFYQASKATDIEDHEYVRLCESPGIAKKLGKRIQIRPDWEDIKISVMTRGLYAKFDQNKHLIEKLLATGDEELVELNYWGDKFWGVSQGSGLNTLGKLIMEIRAEYNNPLYTHFWKDN